MPSPADDEFNETLLDLLIGLFRLLARLFRRAQTRLPTPPSGQGGPPPQP